MFRLIAGLVTLPIAIAADLLSSNKRSRGSGEGDGYNDNYPSGRDAYSGRWTQNEINVSANIDAGMAYKED